MRVPVSPTERLREHGPPPNKLWKIHLAIWWSPHFFYSAIYIRIHVSYLTFWPHPWTPFLGISNPQNSTHNCLSWWGESQEICLCNIAVTVRFDPSRCCHIAGIRSGSSLSKVNLNRQWHFLFNHPASNDAVVEIVITILPSLNSTLWRDLRAVYWKVGCGDRDSECPGKDICRRLTSIG